MFPLFLLRGEFRRNRVLFGILIGVTLLSVLGLFFYLSAEWVWLARQGVDPDHFARQWAIHLSLSEGTLFMILAPFLGVAGSASAHRDPNLLLLDVTPKAGLFYLARWMAVVFFLSLILLATSSVYLYLMKLGLPFGEVIASRVVLFSLIGALSALGFSLGMFLRGIPLGLVVSFLLTVLLSAQILLAGPFLEGFSGPDGFDKLIYGLMLTNGYAGIASAFGLDMMRSGWLYEVSPIGMYRFNYPPWYAVSLFYMGLAVIGMGWGLQRKKRMRL